MNKWVVKIIRDDDGAIVDRIPQYMVDGSITLPRRGEFTILLGVETEFPVVTEDQQNEFVVTEDLDKKAEKDGKRQSRLEKKVKADKAKSKMLADLDKLTDVDPKLKKVLQNFVDMLDHLTE